MGPVVVYAATSLDGFLAGRGDDLSWLGAAGDDPGFGYDEFFARVGALVMGRRTFETVLGFGAWPYGDRPSFVLSSTLPLEQPEGWPQAVTVTRDTPPQLVERLRGHEGLIWLVGGGRLFASFTESGLVDEWILTIAPIVLGEGIPLVTPGAARTGLDLLDQRRLPRGFVQLHYRTAR
jgi:dihydrofolate reductase